MTTRHKLVLIVIASAVAVSCGPKFHPPTGPVVSVTGCGVAEVRGLVTNDFYTWIEGEVRATAPICAIHPWYPNRPPALEIRRAGSPVNGIEELPEPYWFVDFREDYPVWTPSFNPVTEWDAGHVIGTVPPGDYYLVFRYTVGPCQKELVRNVCVAHSETFTISEPIEYVIERSVSSPKVAG